MLHELCTETSVDEYLDFDQDVAVSEGIVDLEKVDWRFEIREECISEVASEFARPMEVADDDEGDDEDVEIVEVERPIISMQAALSHLDDLYTFSPSQGDDVMSEKVVELTKLVEDV